MNFRWLNDTPVDAWERAPDGLTRRQTMPLPDFLRRCELLDDPHWQSRFAAWAQRQPRHYCAVPYGASANVDYVAVAWLERSPRAA